MGEDEKYQRLPHLFKLRIYRPLNEEPEWIFTLLQR